MSNNLEQFRQGLKKAHADLEMEPPFRAVSGHTVTMADVKKLSLYFASFLSSRR